jgi:hypothetical protein
VIPVLRENFVVVNLPADPLALSETVGRVVTTENAGVVVEAVVVAKEIPHVPEENECAKTREQTGK